MLLTPVSTINTGQRLGDGQHALHVTTPSDALEILHREPDYASFILVLRYIEQSKPNFDIKSPGGDAAQLIHVLVFDIAPNFWDILSSPQTGQSSDLQLFLSCLRSLSGLKALLLNLKELIRQMKEINRVIGGSSIQERLKITLRVLEAVLHENCAIEAIANNIWDSPIAHSKHKTMWTEFVGLLGGGKLLGIAAEAEDAIKSLSKEVIETYWIADRSLYSGWLARSLVHCTKNLLPEWETKWKCYADLLSKSLRLGYTGKCRCLAPMT
jgi:telomere length regulation protein